MHDYNGYDNFIATYLLVTSVCEDILEFIYFKLTLSVCEVVSLNLLVIVCEYASLHLTFCVCELAFLHCVWVVTFSSILVLSFAGCGREVAVCTLVDLLQLSLHIFFTLR